VRKILWVYERSLNILLREGFGWTHTDPMKNSFVNTLITITIALTPAIEERNRENRGGLPRK
jgi:hypothetical protein